MKVAALLLSASMLGLLAGGCAREGAFQPKNATQYNYEATSKFVLLDAGAQRSVTCPGLQETRLPDGRLKVAAQLRNRENRRIEVQVNCVFKDDQTFALDETPYRTVILDENATHTVTFESFSKDVSKYTVRVRQAR